MSISPFRQVAFTALCVAALLVALSGMAAAQGADRNAAVKLAEQIIAVLEPDSKVLLHPLTAPHTGLPDGAASRIQSQIIRALTTKMPRGLSRSVSVVTADDVPQLYAQAEGTEFGRKPDELLMSLIRAARADTIVKCRVVGKPQDSGVELACPVSHGRIVCPGGDGRKDCRNPEIRDVRSLGTGRATFGWSDPDKEYPDHVFTHLAWELAREAGLNPNDKVTVGPKDERSARDPALSGFMASRLGESVGRAARTRIGRVVRGRGRQFELAWELQEWDAAGGRLSVHLYRMTDGRTRESGAPIRVSAAMTGSALPPRLRSVAAGSAVPPGGRSSNKDGPDGASPVGGQAILVVETEPAGAEVRVGGRTIGKTPLARVDLSAGSWRVVLDHPSYRKIELQGQDLVDREVLKIRRVLERATGRVTVVVTEPRAGAWVRHDGRSEKVPATLRGLPAGRTALVLGAPGYRDLPVEVDVPRDDVVLVMKDLEPVPYGTLEVAAEPSGASVELLGGAAEYRAGMRLAEGRYRVRVAHPGYRASERDVDVSGTTRVRVVLERAPQPFAIEAHPASSEIRLIGVGERYRAGILLAPGSYRVRVSAPGFEAREEAVEHGASPTRHVVRLVPDHEEVERLLDLSHDDRVKVQRGLAARGFDAGLADGVFGSKTRGALRSWQSGKGLAASGFLTREQADGLMAAGREAFRSGRVFRDCPDCPEMVVVPARSFRMGSPGDEEGRFDNEGPVHGVTISRAFAVGRHEVTRGEFGRFVSATGRDMSGGCVVWTGKEWKTESGRSWRSPGFGQTERDPVVCVSWNDAKAYVKWLSGRTGKAYRLLSESEWEYAARAGTSTRYSWGDGIGKNRANCTGCGSRWDSRSTAPVGSFAANGFGLHDMHGNVREWVEDCWNKRYNGAPRDGSAWLSGDCGNRVLRGGSWYFRPRYLRAAVRYGDEAGYRDADLGFRIARTLTP